MDREPKISEIENLLKHFRETGREHELLEVLARHGIKKGDEILSVIDEDTHEFHEEAIVVNNIAVKEGFLKKTNRYWGGVKKAYKERWYVRYSLYYIFIFLITFMILNAPIIISRLSYSGNGGSKIVTTQELEEVPMADSAPLEAGEVIPAGSEVVVPKLGIKAPIVFLDTREEKSIQAALTKGVVHYAGTSTPGEVGNTFITGHSSNFWWVKGNYNYVFVNLDKLVAGDQAKIYYQGKKYVYTVKEKKVVLPEDTSVLAPTDTPTLSLMTCTPAGTNWKRLIVKFEQVSPKYEKPRLVEKKIIVKEPKNLPSTDNGTIGGLASSLINSIKDLFKN